MNLQYFYIGEFDSPDKPGSGRQMHDNTLLMFDQARAIATRLQPSIDQKGFVVNSGFRTDEHNESVGGVTDSAHTRGYAADFSIEDFTPEEIVAMFVGLVAAGFRRIGWARTFIHADNDPDKPEAVWDYFDGVEHKA